MSLDCALNGALNGALTSYLTSIGYFSGHCPTGQLNRSCLCLRLALTLAEAEGSLDRRSALRP